MEKTNRKILIVDDEQNILLALKRELHDWARSHSLEILLSSSAKEALSALETIASDTDLIISDLRMPEMKGSDFLLEVKRVYPHIITMLLTGYSETEEIVKAVSAGIFSYMLKPWDSGYLLTEVAKAWNYHELQLQSALYTKKIEEELRWAGEMQKALLRPSLPSTGGVEFRVSYRPVSGLYCSGDYYDVISLGTDRYLMLIGDVAGHGVRAAFVTGILKAVIYPEYVRALAGKPFSPADFLGWLNQRMQFEFRSAAAMLISFFVGVLDARAGSFLYANAGQTRPCVILGSSVEELPVAGPAIGSGHSVLYMEKTLALSRGCVLALYTDGLSEVGDGIKVPELLGTIPYGADYHMRVLGAALEKSGDKSFRDDVTLLTACVN